MTDDNHSMPVSRRDDRVIVDMAYNAVKFSEVKTYNTCLNMLVTSKVRIAPVLFRCKIFLEKRCSF